MHAILGNVAALAVATLYYVWRGYFQSRQRLLRQRVVSLLWAVADHAKESDASLSWF